ncbi:unnamed protein product [Cochlearia groenlandica]
MLVLEDQEKEEWSKHIYELPCMWKNVVGNAYLHFVGVTVSNEIVMKEKYLTHPFYIYYYNIEKSTIRRVEILGMAAYQRNRVYTFVDHIENVKLM